VRVFSIKEGVGLRRDLADLDHHLGFIGFFAREPRARPPLKTVLVLGRRTDMSRL
jgi:hypothetical protein